MIFFSLSDIYQVFRNSLVRQKLFHNASERKIKNDYFDQGNDIHDRDGIEYIYLPIMQTVISMYTINNMHF